MVDVPSTLPQFSDVLPSSILSALIITTVALFKAEVACSDALK